MLIRIGLHLEIISCMWDQKKNLVHVYTIHKINTHWCVAKCLHNHKQQLHFPTAETVSIKNTIHGYTASPSIPSTTVEIDDTKVFTIAFCISGGFLLVLVILATTVLLVLSRRFRGNNYYNKSF